VTVNIKEFVGMAPGEALVFAEEVLEPNHPMGFRMGTAVTFRYLDNEKQSSVVVQLKDLPIVIRVSSTLLRRP
jgi:hypothetical protein